MGKRLKKDFILVLIRAEWVSIQTSVSLNRYAVSF